MSMWKECEGLQGELVKMRRELHQIPEFGFDLPETQKYVTDKLDEFGIPYKCSGTDSSIIAENVKTGAKMPIVVKNNKFQTKPALIGLKEGDTFRIRKNVWKIIEIK